MKDWVLCVAGFEGVGWDGGGEGVVGWARGMLDVLDGLKGGVLIDEKGGR